MSSNNNKIAIQGWTIMTECLGGDSLSWQVIEDDKEPMPEIYDTEVQAWKAIAQHQIDVMLQFIDTPDDEADPEMVDWEPTVYIAQIEISEDGELVVRDTSSNLLLETTLSDWRDNL